MLIQWWHQHDMPPHAVGGLCTKATASSSRSLAARRIRAHRAHGATACRAAPAPFAGVPHVFWFANLSYNAG